MFKFLLVFFMFITSAYADPTMVISANRTDMRINEKAALTFTFSQAVTGFDLTKVFVVGGTVTAFAGTGASYTATFTKTDNTSATVQVQNNAYLPAGTGNYLGFNTYKKYYRNSGALFNSTKVEVVARCPLTGETLSNPSTALYVQLFTKEQGSNSRNTYFFKELKNTCLVVLVAGQSWVPKASPTATELSNVHGIHNHTGLYPKITRQQIPTTGGSDKIRVRSSNHDANITITAIGTSATSNTMAIGSHTYTTNVALGLIVNSFVQVANSANPLQYVRGRVVSNTGTALVINVTQTNAVATLASWNISLVLRNASGGHYGMSGDLRFQFVSCAMGFLDPIVKPGQKDAAHHHTFYGNCNINENTTTATLKYSTSSAAGGVANNTGYWAPSMIDTATGVAMNPGGVQVYYKTAAPVGLVGLTEKIPQGMRIIAGDHTATLPQTFGIVYNCFGPSYGNGGLSADYAYIPVCDPTAIGLRAVVRFPSCVKDNGSGGMVLDSPDHISHLAHNFGGTGTGFMPSGCPNAFPHAIPSISVLVGYDLAKGQTTATWRLSSDNYSLALPGGYSYHADWMMGWRDEWMARVVDGCNNSYIDCGNQYVGLNKGIGNFTGNMGGVGIASVTVAGNIATIVTTAPHNLSVDRDATYGNAGNIAGVPGQNNGYLFSRITGVTGVDADAYNVDLSDAMSFSQDMTNSADTVFHYISSSGVQSLKVINATTLQYTLNYFPTNTTPNITGMKIQWGEALCTLEDYCPATYYSAYYPVF